MYVKTGITKFLNDHFLYVPLYLADSVEHKVFDFTLLEKIDKTASMFALLSSCNRLE